jgi:hypothetical protein
MTIRQFRQAPEGPEQALEAAISASAWNLIRSPRTTTWAGAHPAIGAGLPDLVLVAWRGGHMPRQPLQPADAELFAYLRSVARIRPTTLAARLRLPTHRVEERLDVLRSLRAVRRRGTAYSLAPRWRDILAEVVTIEAKVSKWRHAIQQARRNRLFAHRSYVALPERLVPRVSSDAGFLASGVGLLAVDDRGATLVVHEATVGMPRIWVYYYRLAVLAATA